MLLRRIVDVMMTVALLLLMSLQIMEQVSHEYIGMAMVVLVAVHQYLNRKWFTTLLRGRYGAVRVLSVSVNVALIGVFVLSAVSGMIISEALMSIPLEDFTEWGRTMHIFSSYWAFVLMGLHVGLHWGMIAAKIHAVWAKVLGVVFSGWGMYVFLVSGMIDYLTLRSYFVFLDYEKNPALVILENLAMLGFWTLTGYQVSRLVARPSEWRKPCGVFAGTCAVCGVMYVLLSGGEAV